MWLFCCITISRGSQGISAPWHIRPLRWEGNKKSEPISNSENWVRISLSGAADEIKSEPEAPASVTCLSMNFTCWSSENSRYTCQPHIMGKYNKLEVIRYEMFATNSSIQRFTCSGLSVLELCPAPSIHIKGIFVLRYHALLYRIHEPV